MTDEIKKEILKVSLVVDGESIGIRFERSTLLDDLGVDLSKLTDATDQFAKSLGELIKQSSNTLEDDSDLDCEILN